MGKVEKILIIILIIIGINLLFLDYAIFLSKKEKVGIKQPVQETIKPTISLNLKTCPAACLDKINEATRSGTVKNEPTGKIIEKVITIPGPAGTGPKEFWVPIDGTGSTINGGWIDIPGMEIYVDRSKYPDKISVTWEASLKVKDNNGEAHARLFNVNKNGAVDYSEITSIGGDFKRVVSNNINLTAGNNLYRVQMFSTTQYEVYIQGAKIKITFD